jgi:hypothetical protein
MNLDAALAVAAALVAVAFAMSTFERWLGKRKRHEAAWTVAFVFFGVASFALAYGAGVGWNGPAFRVFFVFGAIANVPFLAIGEVELLFGPKVGRVVTPTVALIVAWAAGVVTLAPFTAPIPAGHLVQGSEVFGPLPRILAGVASGLAALVVVAGALWSIVRTRRSRGSWRFVVSNGLIATGTLITGASGLFNSVLDAMGAFAVALVVGIGVIFAGFLLATTGPGPRSATAATAATAATPTTPNPVPAAGATPGTSGNADTPDGDPATTPGAAGAAAPSRPAPTAARSPG